MAKGLYVAEVTEKTASFEPRARVVDVYKRQVLTLEVWPVE